MAKRYGKGFDNNDVATKKPRIESPKRGFVPKDRKQTLVVPGKSDDNDLWGADFDDEAIVEMDFIASQACSQQVNVSVDLKSATEENKRNSHLQPMPLTSHTGTYTPSNPKLSRLKEQHRSVFGNKNKNIVENSSRVPSQKLASSESIRDTMEYECSGFENFQGDILKRGHLNSTFQAGNNVVIPDDARIRQLEKLEQENKKLLDDFMVKEGETVFLRNQLQQTHLRAENERIEKSRLIEELEKRYRAEIDAIHKKKDSLKTQYEFQTLQLGTLMERCKLLENGAVKLTTPQKTSVSTDSPNRSRFASLNRAIGTPKSVKLIEISVQTSNTNKSSSDLKTWLCDHPLDGIPQTIFESSLPEESVVDIQIVEKFGKKNLPILQEEDTFRIFENPELVKPIVTSVDGRQLNVEYLLPDIAVLMKMTSAAINSKDCIPIMNKIVSTTRELLLNSTVVLQTIAGAMKNDDVRDMNDLYFSDFYDGAINHNQTICDSSVWYEKERGIEARRAMGILSYVAETSDYLSEYVTGKRQLIIDNDQNYKNYDKQMIRYRACQKKGHDFEMLEIILDFVTVLGLVVRVTLLKIYHYRTRRESCTNH